jgi:hypothetical protein
MAIFLNLKQHYLEAFKGLKMYQVLIFKAATAFILFVIAASVVGIFYRTITGFFS